MQRRTTPPRPLSSGPPKKLKVTETQSFPRGVGIVQLMGRLSGFIAMHATLGGSRHQHSPTIHRSPPSIYHPPPTAHVTTSTTHRLPLFPSSFLPLLSGSRDVDCVLIPEVAFQLDGKIGSEILRISDTATMNLHPSCFLFREDRTIKIHFLLRWSIFCT